MSIQRCRICAYHYGSDSRYGCFHPDAHDRIGYDWPKEIEDDKTPVVSRQAGPKT